jgi:hypothetical protein
VPRLGFFFICVARSGGLRRFLAEDCRICDWARRAAMKVDSSVGRTSFRMTKWATPLCCGLGDVLLEFGACCSAAFMVLHLTQGSIDVRETHMDATLGYDI